VLWKELNVQLTFRDVLEAFHVSEKRVHGWIEKKDMPYTRVNEQLLFNYISLVDWALEKKIKLTPEVLALGDREKNNSDVLYQAIKVGHIYYDFPGDNPEKVLKAIVPH